MVEMKLSAVILTKNEESALAHCLKSVRFCDEVIVVDDNSTDKTITIAKKLGAKVFNRDLNDDFSAQRNFGLKITHGEWVLFIDSDEWIPENLKKEILEALVEENFNGYVLKRYEVWLGEKLKHAEWGDVKLLRLARKGKGKWVRKVHETWEIGGKVGELNNYLEHRVEVGLDEKLTKVNFYSRLHAEELEKERKRVGFWRVLFMPTAKLGMNYVVKQGFRDGVRGFVLSVVMSFHSFLAWSDLWFKKK